MPRTHCAHGPPWKCPPDLIPHVGARCYCIGKPIPSNFLSLSDKGQKLNDKVADALAHSVAWEECQAGGALEIREGGELRFCQPPTLFPALTSGVWQLQDVDVWPLSETWMREARESELTLVIWYVLCTRQTWPNGLSVLP